MKKRPAILITLYHMHGPMKGEVNQLTDSEIQFGRHPDCQIRFPNNLKLISRKHARIIREGNRFLIIDTSTNGTFINGVRVNQQQYLNSGDVLDFTEDGPKISFITAIKENVIDSQPEIQSPVKPAKITEKSPSRIRTVIPETKEAPAFVYSKPTDSANKIPTPDAPQMDCKERAPLHIQHGPTLQSVPELPVIIGQKEDCDVIITHPMVAPRHVQFFFSQGCYMVKDISGNTLVTVNNNPVGTHCPLKPGDILSFTAQGPAFKFLEGGRLVEVTGTPCPEQPAGKQETRNQPLDEITKTPDSKGIFTKIFSNRLRKKASIQ